MYMMITRIEIRNNGYHKNITNILIFTFMFASRYFITFRQDSACHL